METKRLYTEAQRMQCWAGDTLPVFRVVVTADDITGCSMVLVLEDMRVPGSLVLTKVCTAFEETVGEETVRGFTVQLLTADTAALFGSYRMHFVMTDANSQQQRKLVCDLAVLPSPGVST